MEEFQHDVAALRKRLEELELEKTELGRKAYQREAELEDRLEKAENDARHFKKLAEAKVINIQPGDVFVIDNHEFIQAYLQEFMAMAKGHQCTFVVLPTGGLDVMKTMNDEELAPYGLKKIDQ